MQAVGGSWYLQHAKGEDQGKSNLSSCWHLQLPDGAERDDEHHEVREDVDEGSGDEKSKCVNTLSPWHVWFTDTLEDDDQDQCNAVKEVEPDDDPTGVI